LVRSIVVEDVTEDIKDVVINSHTAEITFGGEKGIIYSQKVNGAEKATVRDRWVLLKQNYS